MDEDFFAGVRLAADFLDEDFFAGAAFLAGDGLVGVAFLEDAFFAGAAFLAARAAGAASSAFGVGLRSRFGRSPAALLPVNKDATISNTCTTIPSARIPTVTPATSASGESIFVSAFFAATLAACFMSGLNARRRGARATRASTEVVDGAHGKTTLVMIECDGALVDVHGDGHRVAFNRAFAAKGVRSANWDHREYASLLRSGGGSAYGMLERYFHFYGYPSELNATAKRAIDNDEYLKAIKRLGDMVPLADAAGVVDAGAPTGMSREDEARMRDVFLRDLIDEKEKQFQLMIDEHALKLRSGVERFVDDCIRENDKLQVLIISETASTSEDRVLEAALHGLGPLRSAAISITGAPESFNATKGIASQARSEAARMMKKTKGDLLAPEIGGNLQRQNFNSDVIIDAGMFSTSRRSMLTAEVISEIAIQRGFSSENVIFIGGSQATCSEATSAGGFSVMVRNQLQRGGEFPGVDSVVDGYGAGEGITLRRILAVLDTRRKQREAQ